jgi:methyltransferase
VIATLGPRWTTRIIVLPGAPLVTTGPYRFVSHPNYCVVAAEILVLPLVFGVLWYGLVFSMLNAAVLWIRIRAEATALLTARSSGRQASPQAF